MRTPPSTSCGCKMFCESWSTSGRDAFVLRSIVDRLATLRSCAIHMAWMRWGSVADSRSVAGGARRRRRDAGRSPEAVSPMTSVDGQLSASGFPNRCGTWIRRHTVQREMPPPAFSHRPCSSTSSRCGIPLGGSPPQPHMLTLPQA